MTVFEYNTPFVIVQVNGMLQKPRITKNGIKVMCQAGYIECDQTLICLALDTYFACPNHRTGLTIRHADLDICQLVHRQPMLFCKLLVEQHSSQLSNPQGRYTINLAL